MSAPSLLNALVEAEPGEAVVYWTGHLAEDCEKKNQAALVARSEAQFAYERGMAELVQRRVGGEFQYLAVKRRHGRRS